MSATSDKSDPRYYVEEWPERPEPLGRQRLVDLSPIQILTLVDQLNDWIEYLEMETEAAAARKSNAKSDYDARVDAEFLRATGAVDVRKATAKVQAEEERVRVKEVTSEYAIRQAQLNNAKNRKDAALALYWGKKNGMVG